MSNVMDRYKIPGWKVRMRTFVITEGESVQVRLNLFAPVPPDKPAVGPEPQPQHTPSLGKE